MHVKIGHKFSNATDVIANSNCSHIESSNKEGFSEPSSCCATYFGPMTCVSIWCPLGMCPRV
jgi:hypothetical protein